MTTNKKVWLGILTFAPIPLFAMYIYTFIQFFINVETYENADAAPTEMFQHFGIMFLYIGIAMIIGLVTLILYIMDIVKNKKFQGDNSTMQVVWILIVILLGTIGKIVYYFVEIIPRKEGEDYSISPVTERTN